MRPRTTTLALASAALLLLDLAGCDSNPGGPGIASAPSAPSAEPGSATTPAPSVPNKKGRRGRMPQPEAAPASTAE
jgi:hypothetical protein